MCQHENSSGPLEKICPCNRSKHTSDTTRPLHPITLAFAVCCLQHQKCAGKFNCLIISAVFSATFAQACFDKKHAGLSVLQPIGLWLSVVLIRTPSLVGGFMVSNLPLNWIHLKIISAVVFHLIGLAKFQSCVIGLRYGFSFTVQVL